MTNRRLYLIPVVLAAVSMVALPAPVGADLTGAGTVRPIPNGIVTSGPDAVDEVGTSRITVFARGTDNQLWRTTSGDAGRSWIGWIPLPALPGGVKGDPTAVSWEPGRIDVFVRGNDDKLWQTTRFSIQGDFGPWIKPVGDDGVLASNPEATVRGPGRLDVFVTGTDGAIYQRFWLNNSWNSGWIFHGDPPGATSIVGDPGAIWFSPIGPNRLELFVRGSDDKLWRRTWNGAAWSDWIRATEAGTLASSPEATLFTEGFGDLVAVFVRGTDSGLYGIDLRPSGIGNWARLGGPGDVIVDTPGATFGPLSTLEVFGRAPSNAVHQFTLQVPRLAG